MLKVWEQPLTEETKAALIERVATQIEKRRLNVPAIMFLEMHKPLANLVGHAAIAFSPFMMPFLGFKTVDEYSQFFSDRKNVEQLIRRLESGPSESNSNGDVTT